MAIIGISREAYQFLKEMRVVLALMLTKFILS